MGRQGSARLVQQTVWGPSFVADVTIYGSAVFVHFMRHKHYPRHRVAAGGPSFGMVCLSPRRSQLLWGAFVPQGRLLYRSAVSGQVGAVEWEGFSQRVFLRYAASIM